VIDAYLAELRRELRGPWTTKASVLREVRDGLNDTVEAHRDGGTDEATAQQRAIDEFGPPQQIAASFNEEMATSAGRHAAVLALFGTALTFLATEAMWSRAPGIYSAPISDHFSVLARGTDIFSVGTAVAAALAAFTLGTGTRWLRVSSGVARIVGWTVLAVIVVKVGAATTLSVTGPMSAHAFFLASPWRIAATAGITLVLAWTVRAALQSIALASSARPVRA
jgi:hypothetical protein